MRYKTEHERLLEQIRQNQIQKELDRLIAVEQEQARIREEQERQAEILAEHTAALAKHEERISKLEFRMAMVEREINHYRPMLEALEEEIEALDNKVWYFEQKGLPCAGIKKQLAQKKEQAYRMETKVIKAEFERDEIMDKLAS